MQVKSIAEYSNGSILQYFGPSLGYHLSIRSLFCLFLSGRFTQVLLYSNGCANLPCTDVHENLGKQNFSSGHSSFLSIDSPFNKSRMLLRDDVIN